MLQFVFSTFTTGFTIFVTFFSSFYYSTAVQRVLFDFVFKKLFNNKPAFPTVYRDFYRLLFAASKITGYQECTVADLVVSVPARSGSVSKIIGRHL